MAELKRRIPDEELEFRFYRAGGPGGDCRTDAV